MLDQRGGACSAPLAAILVVTVLCAAVPLAAWENCSPDDDPSDPTARWLWRVEDYPHPIRHPRYCNRYSASFVCDPDRVIGKKQADALDRLIERIRNETLCICPSCGGRGSGNRGITLGVALMENMQPQPNVPMSETVRLFAETLRKQWGLGHCDDDILLLISTRDHQSHTLVGPAVADVFPQEVADQIYLESRGHFSNCLFYQGLESMVQSYFDMLRRLQAKGSVGQRHSGNAGPNAGLIVGIVFGVLALMVLVAGTLFFLVNRCGDAGNFPGKTSKTLSTAGLPDAWRTLKRQRQGRRRTVQDRPLASVVVPAESVRTPAEVTCSPDERELLRNGSCDSPVTVDHVANEHGSGYATEDSLNPASEDEGSSSDAEDSEGGSTAEVSSSAADSVADEAAQPTAERGKLDAVLGLLHLSAPQIGLAASARPSRNVAEEPAQHGKPDAVSGLLYSSAPQIGLALSTRCPESVAEDRVQHSAVQSKPDDVL